MNDGSFFDARDSLENENECKKAAVLATGPGQLSNPVDVAGAVLGSLAQRSWP